MSAPNPIELSTLIDAYTQATGAAPVPATQESMQNLLSTAGNAGDGTLRVQNMGAGGLNQVQIQGDFRNFGGLTQADVPGFEAQGSINAADAGAMYNDTQTFVGMALPGSVFQMWFFNAHYQQALGFFTARSTAEVELSSFMGEGIFVPDLKGKI